MFLEDQKLVEILILGKLLDQSPPEAELSSRCCPHKFNLKKMHCSSTPKSREFFHSVPGICETEKKQSLVLKQLNTVNRGDF